MPSFFERIKNWLNEDIKETSTNPKGEDQLYKNTDTDTLDLNSDDELEQTATHNIGPEIKDEDYWWCFEGHPIEEVPAFEEIDDEKVCQELEHKIEADEFPVIEIPDNVLKTLQLLNNPEFSYSEVSGLINHSPGMAGEFIKVMNSSLYSRGMAINDLKMVLPRLGKENVKAILYMYSSKLSFADNPLFNKLAEKIVEHSYATALIAGYMSQRYYPDPEGAFLAGLLHNVGKLGILKAISDNYDLPTKLDFEMTEDVFGNIFPNLYEKAGKFLADNWGVSAIVSASIEHHNDFFETGFEDETQLDLHLCGLVNISSTMARILGMGPRIDAVNIFSLPVTVDLNIEKDFGTIDFLNEIPAIVEFKTSEKAEEAENQE